jgi:hypothetical protein
VKIFHGADMKVNLKFDGFEDTDELTVEMATARLFHVKADFVD